MLQQQTHRKYLCVKVRLSSLQGFGVTTLTCLCVSRVFLRAISQYAAVLNKKFLDQTNFELQVSTTPLKTFLFLFK